MVPHSKMAPDPLLEQHAISSAYASNGSAGAWAAWPAQHIPGAVKPVETISLNDGSLVDITVVGKPSIPYPPLPTFDLL